MLKQVGLARINAGIFIRVLVSFALPNIFNLRSSLDVSLLLVETLFFLSQLDSFVHLLLTGALIFVFVGTVGHILKP